MEGVLYTLQETGESMRVKTLIDKARAVVDSLSMACPYLQWFWPS
jgi:hypothetical protein